jgi:hypothetical protein
MRRAGYTIRFVLRPVALCLGVPLPNESRVRGLGEGEMMGGWVMASGKEEEADGEVAAEAGAVARSEVEVREVGVGLDVVSALLFRDQRKG